MKGKSFWKLELIEHKTEAESIYIVRQQGSPSISSTSLTATAEHRSLYCLACTYDIIREYQLRNKLVKEIKSFKTVVGV